MPTVVVVQHVECETLGTIEEALAARSLATRTIRVFAGDPVPTSLDDACGLIVMGGPMSVYDYDKLLHLKQEMRLIGSALALHRPVLGVCLGSQLLAHVLGSKVHAGRQKELGWHRVALSDTGSNDPLFRNAPPAFDAFHWHGDLFELPRGCVCLASSELTTCQAFRAGDNAYGVLFHLEVTAQLIDAMAMTFAEELQSVGGSLDQLRLDSAEHLPHLSTISNTFFGGWAALAAECSNG